MIIAFYILTYISSQDKENFFDLLVNTVIKFNNEKAMTMYLFGATIMFNFRVRICIYSVNYIYYYII